jgi:beta-N-acetylhexosaminidase
MQPSSRSRRRTWTTVLAGVAVVSLGLTACSSGGGATSDPNTDQSSQGAACSQPEQVATWPLKQRAGQLLMGGISEDLGEEAVHSATKAIAKDWVGGVNFLGSDSYAFGDDQLSQAVDAGGAVPPFLAVDQEGGRVQRLSTQLGDRPSARTMGRSMSAQRVKRIGRKTGRAMAKMSLNMNLAPVVDVSNQDDWEVIGDRSFSGDAQKVTEYAGAYADGLRQAGVIPVLKHFPGLGSGNGNTDYEAAKTSPLRHLKAMDLVPYQSLLLEQPVAVMVTNASVPGLTAGKPASLSPATYELLRGEYGFTGVVMTDSLSAAAIRNGLDTSQAVIRAIKAGADVAVWDSLSESQTVRKDLIHAIRKGRVSEDQVNQSVARVLSLKGVDLCQVQ